MIKVLQVGIGPVGFRVISTLRERRLGRLVGAVDFDLDRLRDASAESGAEGASSLAELAPGERPDVAIVTTSSSLEACMDTFRALLDRGMNVVSSCEELLYPWLRHPVLAAELHERAVRGGARILGTGVNPGFLMDMLPVAASAVCNRVERIEVFRLQDASTRRLPFQKKIGAGLDPAAFERMQQSGSLRHVGLGESLHFVAHYLGFDLERWEETLDPVLADRELESGLGPIPAGHAAGVCQIARGWIGERCVLHLEFQAAIGLENPHDRVKIEGTPPLDLVLHGGVHGDEATAAMLLNCIEPLAAAEPGLHTMATIRLPHWTPGG